MSVPDIRAKKHIPAWDKLDRHSIEAIADVIVNAYSKGGPEAAKLAAQEIADRIVETADELILKIKDDKQRMERKLRAGRSPR